MIDELANRADWDDAMRQGYRGTYAEWQHDRQEWMDFRAEFLEGVAETDDFYVWQENKKKSKDFDLSFNIAKEMGFKGTRDQWAKFLNTMRGPSAYEIWISNNYENIKDIFGKEYITEKEWSDILLSKEFILDIVSEWLNKGIHQVTGDEIDQIIDEVIAEKEEG